MKNMKQSQIRCWKSYCSEQLDKIEHYEEALSEDFAGWCMHHRLEIQPDGTIVSVQELKDQGLYYGRPASELVFMRFGEHSALHNKGKAISEESRWKIAEAHKGKHLSEEARQKMSEVRKGKLWWNNGVRNKKARECPGEGWTRGRLRFK